MYEFSAKRFADSIGRLPGVERVKLDETAQTEGFLYLYNNLLLPFLRKPDSGFTLDTDGFKMEDLDELYRYCGETEVERQKAFSLTNLFLNCRPDSKPVGFI